ncbi:Ig-like domain-containing protein [Pontibacillus sp. ALD_SL1]|uniref:NPCBM/NEW2 domain-containing protein n=1 Tax=Pontibacillus sp. ALD_SL1 TaxID=2777185 RepID=UPI001A97CBF3|nr:NPCBM/NEW2 domain-containing protein [Pontibacillus sp. ALD_SL1]QSS99797.1 Ig-like domain-containing protein [Pontibacillus sp. ALD_SL1]
MFKNSLKGLFVSLLILLTVVTLSGNTNAASNSVLLNSSLESKVSDSDDVFYNGWSNEEPFELVNGKSSTNGIGFEPSTYSNSDERMYAEYYIQEQDFTTFEATISLDQSMTTGDNGVTEAVIYADDEKIYSKTFTNTSGVETIKLPVAKGTNSITLYAIQDAGTQGNHALIYDNARLTNSLASTVKKDQLSLATIGIAESSDSDDTHYGVWYNAPFQKSDGSLLARGYGIEPSAYSSNKDRMYSSFYIEDYSYTTLETTISIDKKWSQGDLGKTQAIIYADNKEIYSAQFKNTTSSKDVKVQIPKDTNYLYFYVVQDEGEQGNHGVLFENPLLTNELPLISIGDYLSLSSIGYSKTNDPDDVHYGDWYSSPFEVDGELISDGYGFEPSTYGEPSNMYADFYISDYTYSKLRTKISLDSKYLTGDLGTTTASILADDQVIYSEEFTNNKTEDDIEVSIPPGTKYLRLKASMPDRGRSDVGEDNHAIIFSSPILTNSNPEEDIREYKEWGKKTDVDVDKDWNVEFNVPMDIETIIEKNVYIVNEDNKIVPMLYIIDRKDNATKLTISPVNEYKRGQKYTLWMKDIKGTNGIVLGENVKMDFVIEK